jgi:hypothetical protein
LSCACKPPRDRAWHQGDMNSLARSLALAVFVLSACQGPEEEPAAASTVDRAQSALATSIGTPTQFISGPPHPITHAALPFVAIEQSLRVPQMPPTPSPSSALVESFSITNDEYGFLTPTNSIIFQLTREGSGQYHARVSAIDANIWTPGVIDMVVAPGDFVTWRYNRNFIGGPYLFVERSNVPGSGIGFVYNFSRGSAPTFIYRPNVTFNFDSSYNCGSEMPHSNTRGSHSVWAITAWATYGSPSVGYTSVAAPLSPPNTNNTLVSPTDCGLTIDVGASGATSTVTTYGSYL